MTTHTHGVPADADPSLMVPVTYIGRDVQRWAWWLSQPPPPGFEPVIRQKDFDDVKAHWCRHAHRLRRQSIALSLGAGVLIGCVTTGGLLLLFR